MASRITNAGFSLLEVIVAIAIVSLMAGALAPLAVQQLDSARRAATLRHLEGVARGLIGEPEIGSFGYIGDMGGLPPTLPDLNDPTGKPAYLVDANDGIGYGYAGPYAPNAAPAGAAFLDAWGTPYQYAPGAAQVTSAGVDRVFGTADDLRRPLEAPPTTGSVLVTVLGLPNTGPPTPTLPPAEFRAWIASSVAGARSEPEVFPSGNPFAVTNLHAGLHGVRVRGDGGAFDAVESRRVVSIRRGQVAVTIVLEQP